jgi:predicted ester cyclase
MSQERCEEVMSLYLNEVVQLGKIELLDDIAAEDMVDHAAIEAGLGPGRSGIEQHVRYFRKCMPDLQITIERIIASQDEVVGVWRARGTHSEFLFGIPGTKKVIEVTSASIFRLKEGKIIDYKVFSEELKAVIQMGAEISLPKP